MFAGVNEWRAGEGAARGEFVTGRRECYSGLFLACSPDECRNSTEIFACDRGQPPQAVATVPEPDRTTVCGGDAAGDEAAFAELVRRYRNQITNYVYRMTNDYDTAVDLAQEKFVRFTARPAVSTNIRLLDVHLPHRDQSRDQRVAPAQTAPPGVSDGLLPTAGSGGRSL